MWCPRCGKDTRVLETDKLGETVIRVRWCRSGGCRFLFETHEVFSPAALQCLAGQAKASAMQDGEPDDKPEQKASRAGAGPRTSGAKRTEAAAS